MTGLPPTTPCASALPEAHETETEQPARTRLLLAALRLFAQQGYAKTSIRAIAQAAQANVAAVSYYFGDKAALYSALFTEPCGDIHSLIPDFTRPGLTLRQALHCYYQGALAPLHDGEMARLFVRLHIREMLDQTSHWERELDKDVRRPHHAMVGLLCRHMGVDEPDDDLHRLTLTLTGLAFQLWGHQEVINAVQPQLLATPEAVDLWAQRMTEYALAMVAVEQRLRQGRDGAPATPGADAAPPP
ncbi:MAG: DUF1956 domain-containing protein, partial [Comamonadaceae bacterium]